MQEEKDMEQGDVQVKKTPQQAFVDRLVAENTALKERNQYLESLLADYAAASEELEKQKAEIVGQWQVLKNEYDEVIKELKKSRNKYKEAKDEYLVQKKAYKSEIKSLFDSLKK